MGEDDSILTEAIARHFPGASVTEGIIDLGFGGLRLHCAVNGFQPFRGLVSASLFFNISGSTLAAPVFASMSGYAQDQREAIISGACTWATVFGPVLRAGLGREVVDGIEPIHVEAGGQAFKLFIDRFDRSFAFDAEVDVDLRLRAGRERFGSWLAMRLFSAGVLPLLAADRPTVLSAFAMDLGARRLIEVKVNGCDWPIAETPFRDVPPEPEGAMLLLRELAVLVPAGPAAPLTRELIQRSLEGLRRPLPEGERRAVEWPGFRSHAGRLATPLTPDAIARIERDTGPLPADYREFLLDVGAGGAGPGYGLLEPEEAQRRYCSGSFSWAPESEPTGPPAGVLVLAHAGCGLMWLLALRGPHAGEVWVDTRNADGRVRPVARSFAAWYRSWLVAAVSDAVPWCSWDGKHCSTPDALSRWLEALQAEGAPLPKDRPLAGRGGSLRVRVVGDGPYFPHGTQVDPCESCVYLARHLGLDDTVFAASKPFSNERSFFGKLWDKLRG